MARVFVGLSGGVDSAVSAALLKSGGYDVVGCFIKIWQPEFWECTWREDRLDAMRVAAALEIPFREIDFSDEYKREVVDSMVADYRRGITPNPDVLCNSRIKFGHFFKWARKEGADFIATGHYAQATHQGDTLTLKRGADSNKDQTYFLWQIKEHELVRTLFPVGEYRKDQIRAFAKKYELPNADKPDSQGLCFIGDVSMRDFLARYLPLKTGAVLDMTGKAMGEHHGAGLYTRGQRHGFVVHNTGIQGAQHYVVSVDIKRNTITVSEDRSDAAQNSAELTDVHWISEISELPAEVGVQTRYRETPVRARLEEEGEKIRVVFEKPRIASPGQSLVVYRGDECLGGGVIL